MALKWIANTGWKLTDDRSTPELRLIGSGLGVAMLRRSMEAKTYSRPMEHDSDIPTAPVNPGSLQEPPSGTTTIVGYWTCTDRGASSAYGDAGAKMYTETWEKRGSWETVG